MSLYRKGMSRARIVIRREIYITTKQGRSQTSDCPVFVVCYVVHLHMIKPIAEGKGICDSKIALVNGDSFSIRCSEAKIRLT